MKQCIVISDSFKGTLSSQEICAIARREAAEALPGWELLTLPVADGGEGTVDCFQAAWGRSATRWKLPTCVWTMAARS